MSWRTEQFLPSSDIVAAVLDRGVGPVVASTCDQLGISRVVAQVSVWVADEMQADTWTLAKGAKYEDATINSHVRVRFRRTFSPTRSLFFAQFRLNDPDEQTGLACLLIRGEARQEANAITIKAVTCSAVYNRCNWIDPGSF